MSDEPLFEVSWESHNPPPVQAHGWQALALATHLKASSLRTYLSGQAIHTRLATNPDTGNPDMQVIHKLRGGHAGRPHQYAYEVVRDSGEAETFATIEECARHVELSVNTLKTYLNATRGKIHRRGYTLERILKDAQPTRRKASAKAKTTSPPTNKLKGIAKED